MSVSEPKLPYGLAILCDDIRREVGGKASFMGVYSGGLILHEPQFPIQVNKLALVIYWYESRKALPENVSFRVFLPHSKPQTPFAEAEVNLAELVEQNPQILAENEQKKRLMLNPHFILTPVLFETTGRIEIEALRDGNAWRVASIEVMHQPNKLDAE